MDYSLLHEVSTTTFKSTLGTVTGWSNWGNVLRAVLIFILGMVAQYVRKQIYKWYKNENIEIKFWDLRSTIEMIILAVFLSLSLLIWN